MPEGVKEPVRWLREPEPILTVRSDLARGIPAQITDGCHRACASYYTDENTDIPLKPAGAPR